MFPTRRERQESPGGRAAGRRVQQTPGYTGRALGKDGENYVKENGTDKGLTGFHLEKSLRAELNGM